MSAECLAPVSVGTYWLPEFFADPLTFDCQVMLMGQDFIPSLTPAEYATTFLLTCALELPFYAWAARKAGWKRALAALIVANIATHPLVTFVFPQLAMTMGWSMAASIALKEAFAPLVEAILLQRITRIGWIKALILMISANLFSWWLGTSLF